MPVKIIDVLNWNIQKQKENILPLIFNINHHKNTQYHTKSTENH